MQQQNHLILRTALFLFGLFLNAASVALVTKAALGTSPISSIPYTLNHGFPLTLGQFEILLNFCLIAGQILLLRRNFKAFQLLQIPIALAFGLFIDLWMWMLGWLAPQLYPARMLTLLIGCAVGGPAVGLIVTANVTMLCGEAFVTAWCNVFRTDFGRTKIGFDCTLTALACVLSLALYRSVVGVREGTLIAALSVGWLANRVIGALSTAVPWSGALKEI